MCLEEEKIVTSVKKFARDVEDKANLIVTSTYVRECQRARLWRGPSIAT